MAIQFEKGGKVATIGGHDPKVKIPTAVQSRKLLAAGSLRAIDLVNLEESRGKFVLKMRAAPHVFGHSAWYRDEDWDKDGNLIATGEAKARAIDPYANDRAAGRPCPPLPSVDGVTKPASVTKLERGGRPPKGDHAMTPAERMRALRARKASKPKE